MAFGLKKCEILGCLTSFCLSSSKILYGASKHSNALRKLEVNSQLLPVLQSLHVNGL